MKKRILSVLIGFGLCQSGVWGNGKVESPSVVELHPFSGKEVELEASWIKQREDLDVAYLQSVEADRLLHNFRLRPLFDVDQESYGVYATIRNY